MTTFSFSSLSKFMLAIAFVTVGLAGSAEASSNSNRPNSNRRINAQSKERPTMVAANFPAKAQGKSAPQGKAKRAHQGKRQARHAKRMEQFDTNKDGQLSPAERTAMQRIHFAKIDLNKDGGITLAEMQAAKKVRMAERAKMRAAHPERQGRGFKQGQRKDKLDHLSERFTRLDSNKNGSVSWSEFAAAKGQGREHKQGRGRLQRGFKGQGNGQLENQGYEDSSMGGQAPGQSQGNE